MNLFQSPPIDVQHKRSLYFNLSAWFAKIFKQGSTHFNELTQDLLAACYVYRQGHPEIDPCVPQDAQSSSH